MFNNPIQNPSPFNQATHHFMIASEAVGKGLTKAALVAACLTKTVALAVLTITAAAPLYLFSKPTLASLAQHTKLSYQETADVFKDLCLEKKDSSAQETTHVFKDICLEKKEPSAFSKTFDQIKKVAYQTATKALQIGKTNFAKVSENKGKLALFASAAVVMAIAYHYGMPDFTKSAIKNKDPIDSLLEKVTKTALNFLPSTEVNTIAFQSVMATILLSVPLILINSCFAQETDDSAEEENTSDSLIQPQESNIQAPAGFTAYAARFPQYQPSPLQQKVISENGISPREKMLRHFYT